jgi:shikimate kinase
MSRAIVLVGPMGAGKTTLGKKLAKKLGVRFADTDRLIGAKHGSITRIFEKHGEDHFRNLETKALERALTEFDVVATGGGVVLRQENRELLSPHRVIFLQTDSESVLGKVNLDKRPLLKDDPSAWQRIYDERMPLYESVADATLFTGSRPIRTLMSELEELAVEN